MNRAFFAAGPLLLSLCSATSSIAQTQTIALPQFSGKSYLQTLRDPNGIYQATQTDDGTAVTIVSPASIDTTVQSYDPSVAANLYGEFLSGQADFDQAVSHLTGQSISPQQIRAALKPYIVHLKNPGQASLALDRAYTMTLLASGSGTKIVIDGTHSVINIAYQSPIVQSGRSYGISPGRLLLDQSDRGYLTELDTYLKSNPGEASQFYKVVPGLLFVSNADGIGTLSSSGQAVLTDFLTIYTAELIRHNMVGLDPAKDPWEIDLGEVTLLASYCSISGKVMTGGTLTTGPLNAYGASSIGDHRNDFVALAKMITSYEAAHHPDVLNAVATGLSGNGATLQNDVFRRVLVVANTPGPQQALSGHADQIVSSVGTFLAQVSQDAGQMSSQATPYMHRSPAHK